MLVQEIEGIFRIAPPTLCKTLARITTNKEFGCGEAIEIRNIAALYDWANIIKICFTSDFRNVVCPNDIISQAF